MQSNKETTAENIEDIKVSQNTEENVADTKIDVSKMSLKDLRVFAAALMEENTQLEQDQKRLADENVKLTKIAEKASQLSNMYTTLSKDFDVFRTRNKDIAVTSLDNATADVAMKIVPIYENLKRAIQSIPEGSAREGIELIYRQFSDILTSINVERIPAESEMFDPYRHNAVMAVETDNEELKGRIQQVYSDGYVFKEKVIKQAQVIVYR